MEEANEGFWEEETRKHEINKGKKRKKLGAGLPAAVREVGPRYAPEQPNLFGEEKRAAEIEPTDKAKYFVLYIEFVIP